ncbi:MAG: hypothetical protein ACE5KT_02860 [Methanosarcinales archaeon]
MEEFKIKKFLKKDNTFAVIGASRDPEKYGHRICLILIIYMKRR